MNTLENIQERFNQVQASNGTSPLTGLERNAFDQFTKVGIPTTRNEEWKYTRIGSLFNKEFDFASDRKPGQLTAGDINNFRLPGHEKANELVFVNGLYESSLSKIISPDLVVISLEEAAKNKYSEIVSNHLGHSNSYQKDGIHALNTAFVQDGVFIYVGKGLSVEHPVYIYQLTDARTRNILSQPRSLVYISERADIDIAETYYTLGKSESFTNQVMEVVIEKDAHVEYYKIQNDAAHTHQVSTTHFRQIGKSVLHTVTISLNGGIIRNNLNIAMEAEHSEALLYGLYFLKNNSHIDNHTLVDNIKPNCQSNELYKGVIDDHGTAVFNGKIFVEPQAQKTNAFQSNKNILLSNDASVNTKPQLEIFADDVKCSHGCTVGQLDEEGMFYLRSRGINEKVARSLLIHAFAVDILEHIRQPQIRDYVDQLISERLEFDVS